MVAVKNYTWQTGDDLLLSMVYKAGPVGQVEEIDLTNHSLRMDIAIPGQHPPLLVLNSDEIIDADPKEPGDQADSVTEITLGADGLITITIDRAHTLPPAGVLYAAAEDGDNVFEYDIFLRSDIDKQRKILKGVITLEPSVTLWV